MTTRVKKSRLMTAIRVVVFTEHIYQYLAANDSAALNQCLQCIFIGEITVQEATYLGRVRVLYPLDDPSKRRWLQDESEFKIAGIQSPGKDLISIDGAGKFYFWDEVQTSCFGPYSSRLAALRGAGEYAKTI